MPRRRNPPTTGWWPSSIRIPARWQRCWRQRATRRFFAACNSLRRARRHPFPLRCRRNLSSRATMPSSPWTPSGSATLFYMWESNSTPLTGWQTNSSFSLATTQDPPESFGVEVVVSNSWGTIPSSATLTVTASNSLPPAPVITSEPASLALNAGDTAVFTVGATGESLSFQWKLNNTNLTDGAFHQRFDQRDADTVKCLWRQRRRVIP